MLAKINSLIKRAVRIQSACEAAMNKLQHAIDKNLEHEADLNAKITLLAQQMRLVEFNNRRVSRSEIFGGLRKIAVIQQHMALTRMQISNLQNQRQDLIREREEEKKKKLFWWGRQRKYEYLKKRELHHKLMRELSYDEAEQEEKYNGKSERLYPDQ